MEPRLEDFVKKTSTRIAEGNSQAIEHGVTFSARELNNALEDINALHDLYNAYKKFYEVVAKHKPELKNGFGMWLPEEAHIVDIDQDGLPF